MDKYIFKKSIEDFNFFVIMAQNKLTYNTYIVGFFIDYGDAKEYVKMVKSNTKYNDFTFGIYIYNNLEEKVELINSEKDVM